MLKSVLVAACMTAALPLEVHALTVRPPSFRVVYFSVLVKSNAHEVANESWDIPYCHVRGSYRTREEAETAAATLLGNGNAKQVLVVHHPNGKVVVEGDITSLVRRHWDNVRTGNKKK